MASAWWRTWAGLGAALALAAGAAGLARASGEVAGKYEGNGQAAALSHAVVLPHEPWKEEAAFTVVLTEKDPAGAARPDMDASFGKLGHALIVRVTRSGKVIGAEVHHRGLKRSGFSAVGSISTEGFAAEGGALSGRFFTSGAQKFFGDVWEVDLKVKAALPAAR